MRHRLCTAAVVGFALVLGACTVHQTTPPTPTGPSGFASPVVVALVPFVSFTFAPTAPGANAPVLFNAIKSCAVSDLGGNCNLASPRVITALQWNFGDGTRASGAVVSHAFPNQQTFNVTLTVTNDSGVSNSGSQTVAVGPGALPVPIFVVSPTSPLPLQTVFFNAAGSTPGAGHSIASYSWNFGDGGSASGVGVSHSYGVIGAYVVQLTVTDETGQSTTSAGTTVTVALVPPVPPVPPVPIFTVSPTNPSFAVPPVFFNAAASTTPSGAAINVYRWDFGDGTIITGPPAGLAPGGGTFQAPHHMYPSQGTRNVTLTVSDTNGLSATATQTVTVGP
jgi:PKD repeat protein